MSVLNVLPFFTTPAALGDTGAVVPVPQGLLEPSRRVLVCVLGTSPAVITETLYALLNQEPPFVPDEVHVITTTTGVRQLDEQLLAGGQGAFHRLLAEQAGRLQGKSPQLDLARTVHLIAPSPDAPACEDIVTLADNRAAANTVYRVLYQLKQVQGTQVHASVAGGRKTMSSYMLQAFSLQADAWDSLSHVLVSEPFERVAPAFYFPPATPVTHRYRPDSRRDEWQTISTEAAQLDLAELSVLKLGPLLRQALPAGALTNLDATTALAKGLLEPFEVWLEVREPKRGVKRKSLLRLLGYEVELTPMQFTVFVLHAVAQDMWLHGQLPNPSLAFGTKDDATLTLADWDRLCRIDSLTLAPTEVDSPAPSMSSHYSKIVDALRKQVGLVCERLRLERVVTPDAPKPGKTKSKNDKASEKGRYAFPPNAPTLRLDTLMSAPERVVVEAIVRKLAAA